MGKRLTEVPTFSSSKGPLNPSAMKVTVCFGNVRVIVPCPNREMLVKDLIHQSILRYRKATGKGPESWLVVHKLKTQADGGILDPDDKLVDVTDDREQIMAIFEEENDGMPSLQHNAGDGTSASSVGTSSPDIFQSGDHKFQPFERTEIEITGEELSSHGYGSPGSSGLTLQVRRGSEPALNRLSPHPLSPPDPCKRWSAAPIIDEEGRENNNYESKGDNGNSGSQVSVSSSSRENSVIYNYGNHKGPPPSNVMNNTTTMTVHPNYTHQNSKRNLPLSNQNQNQNHHSCSDPNSEYGMTTSCTNFSRNVTSNAAGTSSSSTQLTLPNSVSSTSTVQMRHQPTSLTVRSARFSRDSNRLSMQFAVDSGKWADAADRALFLSLRKEPVGAATSSPTTPLDSLSPQYASTPTNIAPESQFYVPLNREYIGVESKHVPILIELPEEVMELSLMFESGPLGIHLIPEHRGLIIQSVEPGGRIDRDGRLQAQDKIIEINDHSLLGVPFQQAQELFREGLSAPELRLKIIRNGQLKSPLVTINHVQQLVSKFNSDVEEKENLIQGHERIVGEPKMATVTPTRKSSPAPLQSLPLMRHSTSSLISANTRKIGRKYEIELQKEAQGLGFSITTRDNQAGGNCPIYIKNVLPTGAAIDDGRLRPGDRLLEVNGIEITGKSQSEAVSILRNVPLGGIVKLIVSRQERVDLSPKLPRQIPPEKVSEDVPAVPWSEREIMLLDIPVLDTEKAGLGISVKGKTTTAQKGNMVDNGIYIKSVIHGGAASKDGRLKSNDQLLSVNEISLLDRSNTDAMETLRRTMTQDGPKPKPGFITLKIARRVPSSAPTTDISACGSSASGDEMDSWGSKNVSMSADGSRGQEHVNNYGHVIESQTKFLQGSNSIAHDNQGDSQHRQGTVAYSQNINNGHNRSSSLRMQQPKTVDSLNPHNCYNQNLPYHSNSLELPRNPVLERLTGKVVNAAVRNESYYRATNEPRNHSLVQSPIIDQSQGGRTELQNKSISVQNRRGELVLIENDYSAPSKPPRRSRSSTPEDRLDGERKQSVSSEISIPVTNTGEVLPSDVTYASQTSLEDDAGGFARDAFGRQSMSEKRHATLDAKGTDTYQRNKKQREERERQRKLQVQMEGINQKLMSRERSNIQANQRSEVVTIPRVNSADSLVESIKQHVHRNPIQNPTQHQHHHQRHDQERKTKKDIGPSLGMKKSSSLESLQTMVQEIQIQEDEKSGYGPLRTGPAPVRVVRGRGCNESFRQAVDRSYEAPLGDYENEMETLEEETESSVSGTTNHLSQYQPTSEFDTEEIYGKKGGGNVKKKAGLFRGLGSMFRFGRHRKSSHGPLSANEIRKQQAEIERMEKEELEQAEVDKARQSAHAENLRIQEQYRRLVERQKQEVPPTSSPYGITVSISNKNPTYGTTTHASGSLPNSLRPNHPFRKSMDSYNRHQGSRSVERDPYHQQRDINGNPNTPSHLRSASYDLYNEITRPGSRVGYVDPKKYSHYINYEEIRHHLNRRHQQHYHSQRRDNPKERQERPVSNFYEYETVQGAIHEQGLNLQTQQQPIYVVRNQSGNNGVTLPSPTTLPFNAAALRQRSPSQFQVPPQQQPFYNTRQQQFLTNQQLEMRSNSTGSNIQKQNSLPRRSQNGPSQLPGKSQQQSIGPITSHRHPQQQLGLPGRYTMTSSTTTSTHSHSSSTQVRTTLPQCIPSSNYSQQFVIGHNNYQHSHPHNALHGGISHRTIPSTTSLGSKV